MLKQNELLIGFALPKESENGKIERTQQSVGSLFIVKVDIYIRYKTSNCSINIYDKFVFLEKLHSYYKCVTYFISAFLRV